MTVTVSKEVEFDAGHRVPNHESACKNPHGHRYRVRVTCLGSVQEDTTSPEYGMVVDFSKLKDVLRTEVHDVWDHAFMIHVEDDELLSALEGHGWRLCLLPCVPTAENLARLIYDACSAELDDPFLWVIRVEVWETPTSLAVYEP